MENGKSSTAVLRLGIIITTSIAFLGIIPTHCASSYIESPCTGANCDEDNPSNSASSDHLMNLILRMKSEVDDLQENVNVLRTEVSTLKIRIQQLTDASNQQKEDMRNNTSNIIKLSKNLSAEVSNIKLRLLPLSPQEIYFEEKFNNDSFSWRVSDGSKLNGVYYRAENDTDKGIQTMKDRSLYEMESSRFPQLNLHQHTVVVQYSILFTKKMVCSGSHIRLFPCELSNRMNPLIFGPNFPQNCTIRGRGLSTENSSFVDIWFSFRDRIYKEDLVNRTTTTLVDGLTHVFTLVLHPDYRRTYHILFDGNYIHSSDLSKNIEWPIFKILEENYCTVGMSIYQQTSGTLFDNILVTSDEIYAKQARDNILSQREVEIRLKYQYQIKHGANVSAEVA